MAPTLYVNRNSPACRTVLFVAKILNIDLNEEFVDLRNKGYLKPEFVKINPCHCVPTLVDNDLTLWESRAIAQYLCNQYAPNSELYPQEPQLRARVDLVLNFDLGFTLFAHTILVTVCGSGEDPGEKQLKELAEKVKLIDTLIGDNGYVAGKHLTIADLSLFALSVLFPFANFDLAAYPRVVDWLKRLNKEFPDFEIMNNNALECMDYHKKQAKIRNNKL